jgi:peptide chain release factor 3
MEVCRMRDTPIMTFINKLDREGKEPIELLDEVESVLGIQCAPITWPIGMGKRLRGVVTWSPTRCILSSRRPRRVPARITIFLDSTTRPARRAIGAQADRVRMDIELVRAHRMPFDREAYLSGKQSPVFFGSAVNNFGVQLLLDFFVDLSPPPQARPATTRQVQPNEPKFSGFVFKIQANMDPKHRDRIAFMRVCSGRFEAGV